MAGRRSRLSLGAMAGVGVALLGSLPALAAPRTTVAAPLTATVSAGTGSRAVSLVTPNQIVSRLGSGSATVPLTIVVSETEASGNAAGWAVTVQASDFIDAAGDRVSSAALVDGNNVVSQSGGGGTAAAVTDPGPLDQPQTVYTDTGEDPNRVYTGTFTDSGQLVLTPPDGTPSGVYTSVLTVTFLT